MTHRTDRGLRAFEKLRAMTAHTRRMIGIIDDVRELREFRPFFCGNDVARLALALMLFGRVGKLRVIDTLPERNTDDRDQDD